MIRLRSTLFNTLAVLWTAAVGLIFVPVLVLGPAAVMWLMRLWARGVVAMLRAICRIRVEVRGLDRIPPGASVIVSKHQSAFDTVIWLALLPRVAYVLKKELLRIPIYGWYALRGGMIPVDRSGGGPALRGMLRAAQVVLAEGRQVVIFPEGTRTAPGERVPYQPGVVAIAGASDAPVFPVATDSGRVWPPRSFAQRPGVVRISVLPALPPGLPRTALLRELETLIEAETERLLAEEAPGSVDKAVG